MSGETGATTSSPGQACSLDELRTLFLFEKLTEHQLESLCEHGHVERTGVGRVFSEGEPARSFYVLLEGALRLTRRVGPDEVELSRTDQRGVYAGAWYAYLADRVPQVYDNSLDATSPARFFVLPADTLREMIRSWFPMAVHMLEGLFFGINSVNQTVGQRERLLALGSLSAGLTHELNNPATAAVRAAAALRDANEVLHLTLADVAHDAAAEVGLAALVRAQEAALGLHAPSATRTPTELADAEDAVTDWLEGRSIDKSWERAPVLVQAGIDVTWLDEFASGLAERD